MDGGRLSTVTSDIAWELLWAPYDEDVYTAVLDQIKPDDSVLDIGAGDCRLAVRMAEIAEEVVAIELQPDLITSKSCPSNLKIVIADARTWPFPTGITTAVLLMRHCMHLRLYWDKLTAVGCSRLITNARWGSGAECIDLTEPRMPFDLAPMGWYACKCGQTGFTNGPPEKLTPAMLDHVHNLEQCPNCWTFY